jgi:predicted metal-binding protein
MQAHTKIYMKYFDYGESDIILCEACHRVAQDIHHINGRGKGKDIIPNLMALCRLCHSKVHEGKINNGDLQYIHNNFLAGNRKIFIL